MALTALPYVPTKHFTPTRTTMTTTLYDLIASLQDVIAPGEEELIVPTVLHVLRRHHASWKAVRWEEMPAWLVLSGTQPSNGL